MIQLSDKKGRYFLTPIEYYPDLMDIWRIFESTDGDAVIEAWAVWAGKFVIPIDHRLMMNKCYKVVVRDIIGDRGWSSIPAFTHTPCCYNLGKTCYRSYVYDNLFAAIRLYEYVTSDRVYDNLFAKYEYDILEGVAEGRVTKETDTESGFMYNCKWDEDNIIGEDMVAVEYRVERFIPLKVVNLDNNGYLKQMRMQPVTTPIFSTE